MKTLMIAPVVLYAIYGLSGVLAQSNSTESVSEDGLDNTVLTRDDFIELNRQEFVKLYYQIKLYPMGRFENKYQYFRDDNNTLYLYVHLTQEEQQKQLEEKLQNQTNDIICVDGICLNRELSEQRLAGSKANSDKRLQPGLVVPFAIMTSVFIIVAVVGITGNTFIISGIIGSDSLRNSTSVFMGSLAVSDIIVLAFGLPMQILKKFYPNYSILSAEVCGLLHYVNHFSIVISSLTMAAISVERYIAICHPLKAKSYCTVKNAVKCVLVVWLASLALCVPVLFLLDPAKACIVYFRAWDETIAYYTSILVVLFGIPVVIMAPLYWRIVHTLWKSSKASQSLQSVNKASETSATNKKRKQVIVMLMTVLIVFLLSWGPSVIFDMSLRIIARNTGRRMMNAFDVSIALSTVGICNSLFNPIIYIIQSSQLREHVKSVMYRCCRRGKVEETTKDTESSGDKSSAVTNSETF